MMDEERRQRIIDEFEDALNIEPDIPAYAMTRSELKEMLGIGDKALSNAIADLEKENRLNRSKGWRTDSMGRRYMVEVFWFDDEVNTLHKSK